MGKDAYRLTSPREVRALLERLGHRPNRGMGQNYLIDANVLEIIADAAGVEAGEPVLEIGPGLGALTERLLARGARPVCVEKDPTMAAWLRERFGAEIELIEADALDVNWNALLPERGIRKAAANLPYSVASRLMVDLAESAHRPERMALTIQKEVADRLCARPGDRHYGVLAVLTGVFCESVAVKRVSPSCFLPPPKVVSAVVRMDRRAEPMVEPALYPAFKRLIKVCFAQRRKQIGTILRKTGVCDAEAALVEAGIERTERPERVGIERWGALARRLA